MIAIPCSLYWKVRTDIFQHRAETCTRLHLGCVVRSLPTDMDLLSFLTVLRTGSPFETIEHIFNISKTFVSIYIKTFGQDRFVVYGEYYLYLINVTNCWHIRERSGSRCSRFNGLHEAALKYLRYIGKGSAPEQGVLHVCHDSFWDIVAGVSTPGTSFAAYRVQAQTWMSCQSRRFCGISLNVYYNPERIRHAR